jgi:arylsulfate sulfotransferase
MKMLATLGLALLFATGQGSNPVDGGTGEVDFITSLTITANPSGYAPLTAQIALTTSRPVQVELFIAGRDGAAGDVRHRFDGVSQQATLPVLGLYPAITNTITLRFFDASGTFLGETSRDLTAPPLLADLPTVTINTASLAAAKSGMNLVSYFGHDSQPTPQRPFMFDAAGAIRWYLDFTGHPSLSNLLYDDGVERLANGNLYFGDGSTGRIIEMDMLGRIVKTWEMPGYGFHHNVVEKPNGNFVVTVNKLGAATTEDHLIEIDRVTGAIVRVWDLNQALDNTRRVWTTDDVDWFHANGLTYDPADDTIIVLGRTQGVVKLTNDNEVVWLLAPHVGWATAGNGTDLAARLLQPLDVAEQPITEASVLEGATNHPDFEWSWYPHATELMPDGTLLLFDNGDNRNFTDQQRYSRAVAYRIDAGAMTVRQVWQYGKERGSETFSRIVSDVDYHATEDNVVFMPGAAGSGAGSYGKVIEVDRTTRDVVFEATITPPTAHIGITFHRVERLPLYPPN